MARKAFLADVLARTKNGKPGFYEWDKNNWQPRLSAAYQRRINQLNQTIAGAMADYCQKLGICG